MKRPCSHVTVGRCSLIGYQKPVRAGQERAAQLDGYVHAKEGGTALPWHTRPVTSPSSGFAIRRLAVYPHGTERALRRQSKYGGMRRAASLTKKLRAPVDRREGQRSAGLGTTYPTAHIRRAAKRRLIKIMNYRCSIGVGFRNKHLFSWLFFLLVFFTRLS
ncbi:hypothetical protein GGR52DRAFT_211583 [Hypoxylon sp. FL1284]|nr:hypothetical protein GGR52DRAFT_211583 [Hypoxylon sp. FL1284]